MPDTLFLTLRVFSATGGIEKVCRIFGKALYEDSLLNGGSFEIVSMYDKKEDAWDNPYFPTEIFTGYNIKKISFIKDMVRKGIGMDRVILSHIHLLTVGWLIKFFSPSTRIILLGHGIEIWYPVRSIVKKMLQQCDLVLAVSLFTRNTIIKVHGVHSEKCKVLNNCLDPYLIPPAGYDHKNLLRKKYNLRPGDIVLMTLARLSTRERYKGYDQVVKAMAILKESYPHLKYLVAGSYDEEEKQYHNDLTEELGIAGQVIIPGYLDDKDLEAHFALSTLYVMPSRKEGFGLVFIEAMYYGLPVIAGNEDGSVDALLEGRLGQLVDPEDPAAIAAAIGKVLQDKNSFMPDRELLMDHFSYPAYKRTIKKRLSAFADMPENI